MKAIDIVLPPSKTALEEFHRWQNRLQVQFYTRPYAKIKKIEVVYE